MHIPDDTGVNHSSPCLHSHQKQSRFWCYRGYALVSGLPYSTPADGRDRHHLLKEPADQGNPVASPVSAYEELRKATLTLREDSCCSLSWDSQADADEHTILPVNSYGTTLSVLIIYYKYAKFILDCLASLCCWVKAFFLLFSSPFSCLRSLSLIGC